jgi:ligand-binding sensor domain-containing protein
MFFVTSSGLFHWQKGTASKLPLYLPEGDTVVAVYRDLQHRVWIGTSKGVFELAPRKNEAAEASTDYDAVPRATVRSAVSSLVSDNEGNLWIGTRHDGLWRLGADGLSRWPAQEGLAISKVIPASSDDAPSSSADSPNHRRPFYQTWYFYLALGISLPPPHSTDDGPTRHHS